MKSYIIAILAVFTFAPSCTKDEPTSSTAPIINDSVGALQGQILVKFKEDATPMLDEAKAASGSQISGITEIDAAIEELGVSNFERVFPIDIRREELTRTEGLHLWYILHFGKDEDLQSVATRLADIDHVAKVEYVRASQNNIVEPNNAVSKSIITKAQQTSTVSDPMYSNQWNLHNDGTLFPDLSFDGADVGAEEAWKMCMGDPSIIVAVLDYAVMFDHPDLQANMWVNEGEVMGSTEDVDGNGYAGDQYGYNFATDKGLIVKDDYGWLGHGTHVAGIVSAVNNNGIGIASIAGGSGQNDGVKIMTCPTYNKTTIASVVDEARAMKYAADNGAVILQCSWGLDSGVFDDDEDWATSHFSVTKEGLDYFAKNAGSPDGAIDGGLVIFAGGNNGKSRVGYPGRHEDYISVTSVTPDFTPSIFTNYDTAADIAAPGGDELHCRYDERGMILSTVPTNVSETGYAYKEGTSMSCPLVSGVAALGLSYAVKLRKHFKAEDFRELLLSTATPIDPYLVGTKTLYYQSTNGNTVPRDIDLSIYNGKMGRGIVNAYNLLKAIESSGTPMRIPNVTIIRGETKVLDLASYYVDGMSKLFDISGIDNSVATANINGTELTINGVSNGVTSISIIAQGIDQTISVIVRNELDQSWL